MLEQLQQSSVANVFGHPLHQSLMGNGVEVTLKVDIHYPGQSFFEQPLNSAQRVFAASPGSKPVAVLHKLPLKDGLQYVPNGPLHNPIPHRRYPQGSLFGAAGLGYPVSPHRLRLVLARFQLLVQPIQLLAQAARELPKALTIHPSAASVGPCLHPGRAEVVQLPDLVYQAEPFATFDSVFQSLQHALAPNTPFHPRPAAADFFGLFNPRGYCRRFFFRVFFAHASSIPVPLGSTGVTPLPRYYGHSVLWSGAVLRPFGLNAACWSQPRIPAYRH